VSRRDSLCSIQHVGIAFGMIRPSQGELAASPFMSSLPATDAARRRRRHDVVEQRQRPSVRRRHVHRAAGRDLAPPQPVQAGSAASTASSINSRSLAL